MRSYILKEAIKNKKKRAGNSLEHDQRAPSNVLSCMQRLWLVGSIATGLLYGWSLHYLVAFLMIVQLLSLPIFFAATRMKHSSH